MSPKTRLLLTGVAVAALIGAVTGFVGAYFDLPVLLRGGVTGVLVVGAMVWLRKRHDAAVQKG